MRKEEVHVTTKTGQNKASPIERNTPIAQNSVLCSVYFAIASSQTRLLAGAPGESRVSSGLCSEDRPCRGPSPSKICIETMLLFSGADGFSVSAFAFRPQSLPGNGYGKPKRGLPPFARTISHPASMILRKARPLSQPGNGRMLVTAPLRSHSRGNP